MTSSSSSSSEDDRWDSQRKETPTERLDRNWQELLQELRVLQTGVQLLTGFLLTLPFQQRFQTLSSAQHALYLCAVGFAVMSTTLFIAPVALHRALFRKHARPELVSKAQVLTLAGYSFLALALVSVVFLIFDVVAGTVAGVLAALVAVGMIGALWGVLPAWERHLAEDEPSQGS